LQALPTDEDELARAIRQIQAVCPIVELAAPGVRALIKNLWMTYALEVARADPQPPSNPFPAAFIDATAFDVGSMLEPPSEVRDLGVSFEPGGIDNYLISTTQALMNLLPSRRRTLSLPATESPLRAVD
jgi:hypothetical protein